MPQDLGFSHHHGIQTARYAENVAHRVVPGMLVEFVFKLHRRNVVHFRQESDHLADRLLLGRCGEEHFHPVAGGHQHNLMNGLQGMQGQQGLITLVAGKPDAFPDFHRSGLMVQSNQ